MSVRARKARPARPAPYHTRRFMLLGGLGLLWAVLTVVQWQVFSAGGPGTVVETLLLLGLVNVNILVLLLLLFLTFRNLVKLMFERRRGILGSRLKTKLVIAFLTTTVIPTSVLFLVSAGFLSNSIDSWFSAQVDDAVTDAMKVARSYYGEEEARSLLLSQKMEEAAAELGSQAPPASVRVALEAKAREYGVATVHLFHEDGSFLRATGDPKTVGGGRVAWDDQDVQEAMKGTASSKLVKVAGRDFLRSYYPVPGEEENQVVGVIVLDQPMRARMVEWLSEIRGGFETYRQFELYKSPIKMVYIFPLLLVALLIMFAATWFGFYLARSISEPIGDLADATQRIATGDLDFQLDVVSGDEVGTLVESFNLMTRDLRASKEKVETAQQTLREANAELDARRFYMETVLERIAAGVVGIDTSGRITTCNPVAREMLGLSGEVEGRSYKQVIPPEVRNEFEALLKEKLHARKDVIHRQTTLPGYGMRRTVMVHMTTLRAEGGNPLGTVMVVNDMTDLVKAERAQAWREVARRIAHEIKNPLTPIQLSAQRLRRRYADLLEEDRGAVLDEATSTIVTQVEGLKHLVNEFSRFAKMPDSQPVPTDFNKMIEEVLGLYRPAHPEVQFEVQLDEAMPIAEIDAAQIKRAVVNLLDNAVSALEGMDHGRVEVITEYDPQRVAVRLAVADNGPGLTARAREKLFEPYFSTKKGGTGLGLAIVKSIVADHKGEVRALDNAPQGTRFILEFPLPGAKT